MSVAEPATYTADELLHMPDGDRYELVDGQLVEIHMGALSAWVGGQIYKRLDNYAENGRKGWAFPADAGVQCFGDDAERVRKPDAYFVRPGRLQDERIPDGYLKLVPDVVAEVISPNDDYYAVDKKVQEYLEAGVKLVWVINPDVRNVMVHRGEGGSATRLTDCDELSGEDVLAGFSCQVADLFPPNSK